MMSWPIHSCSGVAASGPARFTHTQPPHSSTATGGARRSRSCSSSKSTFSGTPITLPVVSYIQPWYGQVNLRAPQPFHSVTNDGPRCWQTLWNAASAPSGWRVTTTVSPWLSKLIQSPGPATCDDRPASSHVVPSTFSRSSSNCIGSV